mmetsp:Transcript_3731/g.15084  ORF Transcript_3731/g.15084 Transcript_3731/m.15084 type:complete len:375 (-) Transcript_3731:516-1640(-)
MPTGNAIGFSWPHLRSSRRPPSPRCWARPFPPPAPERAPAPGPAAPGHAASGPCSCPMPADGTGTTPRRAAVAPAPARPALARPALARPARARPAPALARAPSPAPAAARRSHSPQRFDSPRQSSLPTRPGRAPAVATHHRRTSTARHPSSHQLDARRSAWFPQASAARARQASPSPRWPCPAAQASSVASAGRSTRPEPAWAAWPASGGRSPAWDTRRRTEARTRQSTPARTKSTRRPRPRQHPAERRCCSPNSHLSAPPERPASAPESWRCTAARARRHRTRAANPAHPRWRICHRRCPAHCHAPSRCHRANRAPAPCPCAPTSGRRPATWPPCQRLCPRTRRQCYDSTPRWSPPPRHSAPFRWCYPRGRQA